MASTFVLKRKTFADNVNVNVGQGGSNDGKKGSSFGKKLAIGVGTIGATAGTFALARHGKLGAGLQKSANTAWMRAGKHVGKLNEGWGASMQKSALEKYTDAAKKQSTDLLKKAGRTVDEAKIGNVAKAQADVMKNKVNRTGLWSNENQAIASRIKEASITRKGLNELGTGQATQELLKTGKVDPRMSGKLGQLTSI